jgi:hypothetical protein
VTGAAGPTLPPELAGLLRTDGPTGLLLPEYSGRSLPNIASTIARAVGADPGGAIPLAPPLPASLDPLAGRRPEGPVVVLLADAFGWFPFDRWRRSPDHPDGARWGSLAAPITTVFPTTTVAALVGLSSGTCPGQNGIVGYRQFLPRFGVVADLLRMAPVGFPVAESLVGADWTPGLISGAPTIFRRGVGAAAVSRESFRDSGLTRTLYDGAEYVPYATASDLAHQLAAVLARSRPPAVVYAYWDELDTVHHLRGPDDTSFAFEADRLAHLLAHVGREVGPRRARTTTVFVTADHGQMPVDPARQVRVDLLPDVAREMARPLAGDRRAGYFAAYPGRVEALREALARGLPRGSRIVPMAEAIRAGLFGPPPYHPELADRLGDLLALVPAPTGLISQMPGARASPRELLGGHGGLTPEELTVPLVRGSLAEFAGPSPARPARPSRR